MDFSLCVREFVECFNILFLGLRCIMNTAYESQYMTSSIMFKSWIFLLNFSRNSSFNQLLIITLLPKFSHSTLSLFYVEQLQRLEIEMEKYWRFHWFCFLIMINLI